MIHLILWHREKDDSAAALDWGLATAFISKSQRKNKNFDQSTEGKWYKMLMPSRQTFTGLIKSLSPLNKNDAADGAKSNEDDDEEQHVHPPLAADNVV